jgi:hypothetical protein
MATRAQSNPVDFQKHVWPGCDFAFPVARFGAMNAEISATREMVAFFRRQAIP